MNTQSTSPSKASRPLPKTESSKKEVLKVRGLPFEETGELHWYFLYINSNTYSCFFFPPVPIYDGRSTKFDYNNLAKIDGKLDDIFERFPAGEEIPPCSYAVVAYVSQYSSYKERVKNTDGRYIPTDEIRWKLTPFIQWVIIIGISKKNIRGYTK